MFKISKTLTLVSLLASTVCPREGQNHEDSQQVVLFTGNNGKTASYSCKVSSIFYSMDINGMPCVC